MSSGNNHADSKPDFQQVVKEYHQMVYKVCYGFLHNTQDAEDISQETFIKAFHSYKYFRKEAKISSWLYRIAVNQSLNFIRDNKRKYYIELNEVSDKIQNDLKTDSEIENKDLKKVLQYAMSSLPEKQMKIYVLSKFEYLTTKEIANILDCSISSVEVSIHRANKALKKKLIRFYTKNYLKL